MPWALQVVSRVSSSFPADFHFQAWPTGIASQDARFRHPDTGHAGLLVQKCFMACYQNVKILTKIPVQAANPVVFPLFREFPPEQQPGPTSISRNKARVCLGRANGNAGMPAVKRMRVVRVFWCRNSLITSTKPQQGLRYGAVRDAQEVLASRRVTERGKDRNHLDAGRKAGLSLEQ